MIVAPWLIERLIVVPNCRETRELMIARSALLEDLIRSAHGAQFSIPPSQAFLFEIAEAAARARFPEASQVFVFGSALTDSFNAFSDLDIIVMVPNGRWFTRECRIFDGVPVDIQAFGRDAIEIILEQDRRTGYPTVLLGVAHGRLVFDADGVGEDLRDRFLTALEVGPRGPSPLRMATLRNDITEGVLDLLGCRDAQEAFAVGMGMYSALTALVFSGRGLWIQLGKHGVRQLREQSNVLGDEFQVAYQALARGECEPLAELAAKVLAQAGGAHWDGYTARMSFAGVAD
jgi:hypothetical protein